ncbi:MAG TPA: PDZ domain-containing protein, partial [Thermodesulfovibrionales bacterium]|nr:PDZ domain-containing protein [Thermodesulfovibrionales bacterium]
MNSRLLNWFILVSIGLYIAVPILGVVSFLSSPYTGIRFYSCEKDMQVGGVNRTCIRTVDVGSPADIAGIRPGDMVIDINGLGYPSYAYIHDPDYIGSDSLPLFWEAQKRLGETVKIGKPVDIIIERDGIRKKFSLVPLPFSLRKVLDRQGFLYFLIWTGLILPYLLLRKKRIEVTVIFFIYWLFLDMNNMSTIFFARDLAYPYIPLKVLHLLNHLPFSIAYPALIHLGLIFPERKGVIKDKPWILGIPYVIYGTIFLLKYIRVIETRYMIGIFSTDLGWILFSIILLYKLFNEKEHLKKRQIQLVLIGVTGPYLIWYPLVSLPNLFWGIEIIPIGHILFHVISLTTIAIPVLSLAIAVTKYKLLEIEELFDYGVIFSATLLILFGAEFIFLSALSPFYSDMLYKSPYLSTVPA